jgi:hypothetical protein
LIESCLSHDTIERKVPRAYLAIMLLITCLRL